MQTATGAIGPKTSVCASSTVGKAQLQAISRFVEVQSDGLVRLSSHIVGVCAWRTWLDDICDNWWCMRDGTQICLIPDLRVELSIVDITTS